MNELVSSLECICPAEFYTVEKRFPQVQILLPHRKVSLWDCECANSDFT